MLRSTLFGKSLRYRVGAPGEHWALNSLGALAVIASLGADAERAAADMASLSALAGRGARQRITGPKGAFDLIDESYNANPLSMAVSIATLGRVKPGPGGRRIAVLGRHAGAWADRGRTARRASQNRLAEHGIDLVFASGPLMNHLWPAIAERQRGGYASASSEIARAVADTVRAGDIVMVKGSNGSKMRLVVEALRALAAAHQ